MSVLGLEALIVNLSIALTGNQERTEVTHDKIYRRRYTSEKIYRERYMRRCGGMKREILFRGKRMNNGKWVYGNYIKSPTCQNLYMIEDTEPTITDSGDRRFQGCPDVDPATVGQYTGLKDKNGKRIFEGDMLKVTWNAIDREPYSEIHLVKFCKGCFCVSFGERSRGLLSGYIGMTGEGYAVTVEVIGNIHDNPELMDGGAENG